MKTRMKAIVKISAIVLGGVYFLLLMAEVAFGHSGWGTLTLSKVTSTANTWTANQRINGKLGINQDADGVALEINVGASATDGIFLEEGSGNGGAVTYNETTNEIRIAKRTSNSDVGGLFFNNAGLIGTATSPQHKLSIYDATPILALTDTDVNLNVGSAAQAIDTAAIIFDVSATTSPTMKFIDNTGTTMMEVLSNGNFYYAKTNGIFGMDNDVVRKGNFQFASSQMGFRWGGTDVLVVHSDAGVTTGALASQGSGSINADSLFDNGTKLNAPDFVFRPDYNLLTIEEMNEFINKNDHLPTMPKGDEHSGNVGRLIKNLWETVEVQSLYIIELEQRLTALENLQ